MKNLKDIISESQNHQDLELKANKVAETFVDQKVSEKDMAEFAILVVNAMYDSLNGESLAKAFNSGIEKYVKGE